MKFNKSIPLLGLISLLGSCNTPPVTIHLTNNLSVERKNETVEISITDLPENLSANIENIGVYDPSKNTFLITQLIDLDQDGKMDQLIFQPQMAPLSEKIYHLKEELERNEAMEYCFSRIVPTRIDDYTWENDRVAFRTYGPAAQALVEEGKAGGIISSGIDCWLKKVNYPVINKWYKAVRSKALAITRIMERGWITIM